MSSALQTGERLVFRPGARVRLIKDHDSRAILVAIHDITPAGIVWRLSYDMYPNRVLHCLEDGMELDV
jgi:hypothetical protein